MEKAIAQLNNEAQIADLRISQLSDEEQQCQEQSAKQLRNIYYQCLMSLARLEVDYHGSFVDFTQLALVKKSKLYEMDDRIKESKDRDMEECKREMRSVFEKELSLWKLKKIDLKIKTAKDHLKSVKSFKLTKEIQNILLQDKQTLTKDMKLIAEKIGKGIENYKKVFWFKLWLLRI